MGCLGWSGLEWSRWGCSAAGGARLGHRPALLCTTAAVQPLHLRVGGCRRRTVSASRARVHRLRRHPEKNAFEWTRDKHIPHSAGAVAVTQAVANAFVAECRRSPHRPRSDREEEELLIYNYPTIFTGKTDEQGLEVDFDESYFFPSSKRDGGSGADSAQRLRRSTAGRRAQAGTQA